MKHLTAYHQLGRFIVGFQRLEAGINDILVLLSGTDDEAARILINELEFSQRIKTADVLYARFVDVRSDRTESSKSEFHKIMTGLAKLGERRNELVHSKFTHWTNVDMAVGLIRENSKLRAGKGLRELDEEELLPESFDADLAKVQQAGRDLDLARIIIINQLYPTTGA
jgi:hypothetical protein